LKFILEKQNNIHKNEEYSYDLHIHSIYSYDSLSKIEDIIEVAIKKNLSGIAITDHNEINGALKAKKIARGRIDIILGEEINTNEGQILALFIQEKINEKDLLNVLDNIHSQDGLAILPHPTSFRNRKLLEKILKEKELRSKINAIEAFNARNIFSKDNEKAYEIAEKEKFPIIGGSDAHTISEIGSGKTIIKDFGIENLKKAILNCETHISGKKLSITCHFSSIYATFYKKFFRKCL